MSTETLPFVAESTGPDAPDWPRHTFTADDIVEMLAAGILQEDEPLEFLRGELYPVSPQSSAHANLFSRLYRLFSRRYPEPYWVTGQVPLDCSTDSQPEPDLMVLRNDQCQVEGRHPRGSEALLVIEVAVTSQARDRWKAGLYAEAGIPEYWLLDLAAQRIEVYRKCLPAERRYGVVSLLEPDAELDLPELGVAVRVADLLPL